MPFKNDANTRIRRLARICAMQVHTRQITYFQCFSMSAASCCFSITFFLFQSECWLCLKITKVTVMQRWIVRRKGEVTFWELEGCCGCENGVRGRWWGGSPSLHVLFPTVISFIHLRRFACRGTTKWVIKNRTWCYRCTSKSVMVEINSRCRIQRGTYVGRNQLL